MLDVTVEPGFGELDVDRHFVQPFQDDLIIPAHGGQAEKPFAAGQREKSLDMKTASPGCVRQLCVNKRQVAEIDRYFTSRSFFTNLTPSTPLAIWPALSMVI